MHCQTIDFPVPIIFSILAILKNNQCCHFTKYRSNIFVSTPTIGFITGKKCTYGHKCKYYHPERANQPQRAVADELRAFAKLSAVKTMSEGALVKCGTSGSANKGDSSSEAKRVAPKRQSDPSIRSVACEQEERLCPARKAEANSVPSLVSALSVPTMPLTKSHAAGALNTRSASSPVPGSLHFTHSSLEHAGSVQYPPILVTNSQGASVAYGEPFPKYDSVVSDHGYYSMLSDFSTISLQDSFCSLEQPEPVGVGGGYPGRASVCPEPGRSHSSDSFSSYSGEMYLNSLEGSLDDSMKGPPLQTQTQPSAQTRFQALLTVSTMRPWHVCRATERMNPNRDLESSPLPTLHHTPNTRSLAPDPAAQETTLLCPRTCCLLPALPSRVGP